MCFLSLIDDYIMSYSNCQVWSYNGNQPLMNAIKYNTTSLLGLPKRDLWVKLQQWLKTENEYRLLYVTYVQSIINKMSTATENLKNND